MKCFLDGPTCEPGCSRLLPGPGICLLQTGIETHDPHFVDPFDHLRRLPRFAGRALPGFLRPSESPWPPLLLLLVVPSQHPQDDHSPGSTELIRVLARLTSWTSGKTLLTWRAKGEEIGNAALVPDWRGAAQPDRENTPPSIRGDGRPTHHLLFWRFFLMSPCTARKSG